MLQFKHVTVKKFANMKNLNNNYHISENENV